MTDQSLPVGTLAEPTAEVIAHLLDGVATHDARDGLTDVEQIIVRLRSDAEEAFTARDALRNTSADVLREALRLRAAPPQATGSHSLPPQVAEATTGVVREKPSHTEVLR